MNPVNATLSVDELLVQLSAAIYDRRLGWLAVTGILTDWRRHRYGSGSGELSVGSPPTARLRLHADRHAAPSIDHALAAAGHDPTAPAAVTVHGQVVLHPRWGLQLATGTITLHHPNEAAANGQPDATTAQVRKGNHRTIWPERIDTIGLVAPLDGDDARTDVIATLAALDLTIVEHRVPLIGTEEIWRLTRALDQLADDPRPDVTVVVRGGGPDADLAVFDHPAVTAAIARHPRPVVTGIGHATNTTAADRAARLSCITPTAAAAVIADHYERRDQR